VNDVQISVIVAIYNPGKYLQRCMDSLLGQSLDPDSYEIVLVDDGSTDGTGALLDDYAERFSNVRVHHQENSGWPGKPRNVGLDLARGEYVQFVDQDDALGPEALARQYAFAKANNADVLVGKIVNTVGNVAHNLFTENRDRCTLADLPLINSLSPHKVFRLEFLREHDIRFPEGKCRLEDQLFMAKAYLDAETISVLADYPCYYWLLRDDGKHSSRSWSTPAGYFDNLRDVLDAVEARTEPGPFRDSLLKRFLEQEMLHRMGTPLTRFGSQRRQELYDEIRKLYFERFHGHSVEALLTPIMRLRAALLAEDRMADLLTLAPRVQEVHGHIQLHAIGWDQGRLRGHLTLTLRHADGTPLTASKNGSRYFLDERLTAGVVEPDLIDVTDEIEDFTADISIKHRESALIWFAQSRFKTAHRPSGAGSVALGWSGEFELDPAAVAGGGPLDAGTWDVRAGVRALGLSGFGNIGSNRDPGMAAPPAVALAGEPAFAVRPYWTVRSNLALVVGEVDAALFHAIGPFHTLRPRIDQRTCRVAVPLVVAPGTKPHSLNATLRVGGSAEHPVAAEVGGDGTGGGVITATLPEAALEPRTRGELTLRLPGNRRLMLARLQTSASGQATVRPAPGRPRRAMRRLLSNPRVKGAGRKLLRRAPAPIERTLRKALARAMS
jgi:poly(ribitol-phosphate) beta-N-acetylglucosaminyltransferase